MSAAPAAAGDLAGLTFRDVTRAPVHLPRIGRAG